MPCDQARLAGNTEHLYRRFTVAKTQDKQKGSGKKRPQKSIKEKRAAKKGKRAERDGKA